MRAACGVCDRHARSFHEIDTGDSADNRASVRFAHFGDAQQLNRLIICKHARIVRARLSKRKFAEHCCALSLVADKASPRDARVGRTRVEHKMAEKTL